MEAKLTFQAIAIIIKGLEIFGVAIIGFAFLHATLLGVFRLAKSQPDTYERFKLYLGKALQLGIEFLVAADIVRTVTVAPTLEGILALGLLVVVRTFLSWSITVEIEGCWPWQVARKSKESHGQQKI